MAIIKSAQSGTLTRQAMVLDMSDLGRQAQRMLDHAQKQAAQVVTEAEVKAQALIDRAEERGFAQGLERGLNEGRQTGGREGYEQAIKDWSQRLEQVNASLGVALQNWERQRDEMVHQATEDVIAFAVEVARRVTHRLVRIDGNVARDQVAAALQLVSKPTAIEIVVHPQQRDLIESNLPQLIAGIASCQHVSIRDDASMTPGGCVINTAGGRVDASIETQLQRIAECFDLAGKVARRPASCEANGDSFNGADSPAPNDAERRPTTNPVDDAERQPSDGGETPRTNDPST